jgi:hypothetical protein
VLDEVSAVVLALVVVPELVAVVALDVVCAVVVVPGPAPAPPSPPAPVLEASSLQATQARSERPSKEAARIVRHLCHVGAPERRGRYDGWRVSACS